MSSNIIRIRYEGLDADENMLDLRAFGRAALGLDNICNTGLIALSDKRFPKKNERFPFRIMAQEPKKGSFEWYVNVQPFAVSVLPLAHEFVHTKAGEVLWHWISWVTNMTGGRQKDADPHFKILADIHKEQIAKEERMIKEEHEFFSNILDRMQQPARDFVNPVRDSVEKIYISASTTEEGILTHTVDRPMADAIISKETLEVGDVETLLLRVDGLIHHSRQLKVKHPDINGKFISADVRDPAFENEKSIYTEALSSKGLIEASVKPTRTKDGILKKLYILDAKLVKNDQS